MIDWTQFRTIESLREAGQPAEALLEFQRLRETCTDEEERASVLLHEGLCYYDLARLAEGERAVATAMHSLPPNSQSRAFAEFSLACIHEHQERLEEAAQELRGILHRYTDVLNAREHKSFKRTVQLRLISNLVTLEHSIEPLSLIEGLKTESTDAGELATLAFWEALARGLLGRKDEALKCFEEALSGALDLRLKVQAHIQRGAIFYERGDFDKALREFKGAEKIVLDLGEDRAVITQWMDAIRARGNQDSHTDNSGR